MKRIARKQLSFGVCMAVFLLVGLALSGCQEDTSNPVDADPEPSPELHLEASETAMLYTPMAVGSYWQDRATLRAPQARRQLITDALEIEGRAACLFRQYYFFAFDDEWINWSNWYYRYWDDGVLYEIPSSDPFDDPVPVQAAIDPDLHKVGDTLSVADLSYGRVSVAVLEEKGVTVEVPAGTFNDCYTVRITQRPYTWREELLYVTHAPGIGWIRTDSFHLQASGESGEDTTSADLFELHDYQRLAPQDAELKPITTPVPAHQAGGVFPDERAYYYDLDIPAGWLQRYGAYMRWDNSVQFFDFNQNQSYDLQPSYIKWSTPYDHTVRIYDIYFGFGDNPPLIESDYVLRERNRYPVNLLPDTTYSWRIDVKFEPGGAVAEGPVWTFQTGPGQE